MAGVGQALITVDIRIVFPAIQGMPLQTTIQVNVLAATVQIHGRIASFQP